MHQYHFDIIVLGESLAARLAATLLAKSGKKVLTFQDGQAVDDPWLFTSPILNRILDQLGGRDGLTTPSKFQVITEQSRLELHGRHGLDNELRREFPSCHNQPIALLRDLETFGQRLENQLWANGGLPLIGSRDQLRFGGKLLFSKPGWFTLRRPLAGLLDQIGEPTARACLAALFSGLAMTPLGQLTVAEGALLWNAACQPQGISAVVLDDLLRRRYKQFHGAYKQLASVEQVDADGRIHLKNAKSCSAETILIGQPEGLSCLANPRTLGGPSAPRRWRTSILRPGVSSLLAPRIILDGAEVLRANFASRPEGVTCAVEGQRPGARGAPPTAQAVQKALQKILPFVSFEISEPDIPDSAPVAPSAPAIFAFPGTARHPSLNHRTLLCIGAATLPHLGGVGEVLTGFSLASYLLRRNPSRV